MLNKLKSNRTLVGILILGILAFALPITLLLLRDSTNLLSRAALPDQLESESGVLSSSGVSKQSDSQASGGQFIRFAKSGTAPTPTSPLSQSGYGPRYSLYGSGSSGNYPVIPAGAKIVVVDNTVPTDGRDAHRQLSAFLQDRSKVPDGIDASRPTIVVFDKTATNLVPGQKPNHGSGTQYTVNGSIDVIGRYNHVYLWGYNSKIYNKSPTSTINLGAWSSWSGGTGLPYAGGAFIGFQVLGFEIQGSHTNAYTANAWETAQNSDSAHAIYGGGGFQNLKIMDNYAHHIHADFFWQQMWGSKALINWLGAEGSKNYEIAYNHVYGAGRQGVHFGWGDGFWMHHNLIEGVGMQSFTTEDDSENADPHRNVLIEQNHFRHWQGNTRWLPPFPGYGMIGGNHNRTAPENITIRHNKFSGGTIAREPGYEYSPIWMATCHYGCKVVQNLVFEDNWMDYTDWPEGNINRSHYDSTQAGNFLIANGVNNLTVRRNNFGNRGISIVGATGNVIVEDVNGIVVR